MTVKVAGDAIAVVLHDGRTVTVPIAWFPRIAHASARERRNWRLIAAGDGIHWPDLDEDISIAGILMGRPSAESAASFERWLASRGPRAGKPIQPARAKSTKSAPRRHVRG